MSTATKQNTADQQHLSDLLSNPKAFSISTYLNKALEFDPTSSSSSSFDDEELQRKMAELALQLQVQTQSCHDEIGRIGAELRAILPRCAGDLGRLNVGLDGMKEDAQNLLEEHLKSSLGYVDPATAAASAKTVSGANKINGGNGDHDESDENAESNGSNNDKHQTGNDLSIENEENIPPAGEKNSNVETTSSTMTPLETLETLSTLHALQQNLTATKSILHSVSTYDKTITSLPSLLTSSENLNHAVSALTTLEEGARALSGMPGQEQRMEEIASTRKKILTLLKPELLHALKKMESRLGPLQTCVGMYNSLGKIENLMEEYVKNRPSSVHSLWFEYGKTKRSVSGDIGGNAPSANTRSNELEFYSDNLDDEDLFGEEENEKDDEKGNDIGLTITPFGEWLPTWYEAVLLLLSEEQRRALTVFGPELAPEIMAKVCQKFSCFFFSFEQ